jgi:acetyl esterase/lipase
VYLHGGRFRWGDKHLEARPLLHRLASEGWLCVSANYHLSETPAAGFPRHLIDVKRVIAWARLHGREFGGDPDVVVVAGSSAGGHLAAMAALTPSLPQFQPGFETIDTSVTAAIGLGGYYGPLGKGIHPPASPVVYAGSHAPPFLIVHGQNDTYTAAEGARDFVERLRAASKSPVAYAELPGGQHAFDLFRSIRFERVVDGVESFLSWVRSNRRTSGGTRADEPRRWPAQVRASSRPRFALWNLNDRRTTR